MPYEIWEIPEDDRYPSKEVGKTVTPGGALTRINDEIYFGNEDKIETITHTKEEGGGHTVLSERPSGNRTARTSFHVK
jgi:hypothetical protein